MMVNHLELIYYLIELNLIGNNICSGKIVCSKEIICSGEKTLGVEALLF